jgi:hypothetical protein
MLSSFQLCEAKIVYTQHLDICWHASSDMDQSTTCSVVSRLCQQAKNKGNTMYMDLVSCPESFWSVDMYSGGCGNNSIEQKRVTWQVFSDKLNADIKEFAKDMISWLWNGKATGTFTFWVLAIVMRWLRHWHPEDCIKEQNLLGLWTTINTELATNLIKC